MHKQLFSANISCRNCIPLRSEASALYHQVTNEGNFLTQCTMSRSLTDILQSAVLLGNSPCCAFAWKLKDMWSYFLLNRVHRGLVQTSDLNNKDSMEISSILVRYSVAGTLFRCFINFGLNVSSNPTCKRPNLNSCVFYLHYNLI